MATVGNTRKNSRNGLFYRLHFRKGRKRLILDILYLKFVAGGGGELTPKAYFLRKHVKLMMIHGYFKCENIVFFVPEFKIECKNQQLFSSD